MRLNPLAPLALLPCLAAALAAQAPALPAPYATPSVNNNSRWQAPPADWTPTVPAGFHVSVYAEGLTRPRWLAVAPNGDLFVAETTPRGEVDVLHGGTRAETRTVFADQLLLPFGIAFHGDYVYVGDNNEVIRFKYDPRTSARLGEREHVLDLPPRGEHFTRTLAFSPDGKHLFVSAGSNSNYGEDPDGAFPMPGDPRRAAITECDPDGGHAHLFATGLRNAVGLGVNPASGQLWASVNERDLLGDDLPPDYFTSVRAGGFYGWPYSYIGAHVDERVKPQRPDLVARAIVPDVLLRAHVAPLQFQFYQGQQFPVRYHDGAFLALHGSWNRSQRQGYAVVFVPFRGGKPAGAPQPFFQGFVPDPGQRFVYGRPVGVAVAADGALLVSDDGAKKIWRIGYGH